MEDLPVSLLAQSLTSSEANQRLLSDTEEYLNNIKLFTWKNVVKIWLPRIINSFYLCCVAFSLLLLIVFCETDNFTSILQFLVVLVVLMVNFATTVMEARVHFFWHKNKCMSKLADFVRNNHNWTYKSYPSQPLSTLRSQITVKGLRDKELVNIPCTILVCGDIVQLNLRFPAPANVKVIKMQSTKLIPEELKAGEIGFDENESRQNSSLSNTLYWYKVTQTPFPSYISHLGLSGNSDFSKFYQQKQAIDKIFNFILIPLLFLLSLCFNLIRWLIYRDYFDWTDAFINWPLLTVLPLVSLCLPSVWAISNSYGASSLDSSLRDDNRLARNSRFLFISSIVDTFKALLMPFRFPKMEVLHSFSNITAVCAVDKEYILTGSFPTAEKMFFFKSNSSTECTKETSSSPAVEIITEILDISPNTSKKTGLSFDEQNWQMHINSLKAIGLNLIVTSHLPNKSVCVSSEHLHYFLSKTQCCCSVAYEIGISKFASKNLKLLSSALIQINCDSQTENIHNLLGAKGYPIFQKSLTHPHLVAVVCHDQFQNCNILMSRGSGDIIAQCCSDLWDGQDLQPMTDAERSVIIDFFTRRSMSSYCIALAYNPLFQGVLHSEEATSESPKVHSNVSLNTYSQLPSDLLSQVFVGMVSLQYQPKSDIVSLVQNLKNSGIRFIYFTAENEVRGRIFAEKLGLEAGWNCHISLSSHQPVINDESDDYNQFDCESISSGSSLTSIYNVSQAYIKAQLPKGVDKIRSHLKYVDNVPLLVPLFTDCSPEAVREMITIMQENGEIVLCMGNAWVIDNLPLFKQAEIGLSLIPSNCDITESDCCMLPIIPEDDSITPLNMAATLTSITSEIQLKRNANVSLHNIITKARHLQCSLQKALLFALGSSLMISCTILVATLFFLPSPLSRSHEFFLLLFIVPILSFSLLSIRFDTNVERFMPDREISVYTNDFYLLILYFAVSYIPAGIVCVAVFWLTLNGLCLTIDSFLCNPVLGNVNSTNFTVGWLDNNYKGYVIAQDCTFIFVSICIVISSLMYIHQSQPLYKCYKYISWPFIVTFVAAILAQFVYFAVSEIIAMNQEGNIELTIRDVPLYSWFVGIIWLPFQLFIQELVKLHMKKTFVNAQRKLRLAFQTKLGMNSPF